MEPVIRKRIEIVRRWGMLLLAPDCEILVFARRSSWVSTWPISQSTESAELGAMVTDAGQMMRQLAEATTSTAFSLMPCNGLVRKTF